MVADTPMSRISRRRNAALSDGSAEYAARRAQLIGIAAQVFHEKGYASSTLSDIAQIFGTDRASLYYYAGGKEELLREGVTAVVEHRVEEAEAVVVSPATPLAKASRLIRIVVDAQFEDFPAVQVFIRESAVRISDTASDLSSQLTVLRRRLEKCFTRVVEEGVASGVLRDDVPVALLVHGLLGTVLSTHRWIMPGGAHSAAEVAEAFEKLFLQGAQSRSAADRE